MSRKIERQLGTGIAIAVMAATALTSAQDAAGPLPVVAPVKLLSSSSELSDAPAMEMMFAEPDRPQPTLPGGKLPQYQVGRVSQESLRADDPDDARLRFLLALPARPVLVEAEITIDGRPFRMAREQRIAAILEALRQPPAVSEPVSTDAADDAEVESSTDQAEQNEQADAGSGDEGPAESEAEPVTPATVAPYSVANSASEYVRRYAAATGQAPSADEVRWLLANWSEGPVLLLLQENFQRFRAGERPAFDVLDRNRDGIVDADELARAVESFMECDLNRDEVVDATELAAAAKDVRARSTPASESGPLIFAMPDVASAGPTSERLAARYESTTLPRFDADAQPDVKLVVAFDSGDPSASTISLTAASAAVDEAAHAVDTTITLRLAGATVHFSAVQGGASDQVSLGAVVDGYPLLPEIDLNDDGRFTIREMRGLVEGLKRFDRNGDGRLTADEVQPPVRVCFGLGPVVHRELAGIRSVYRGPQTPPVQGPDWFVRMDRNRDGDLTRGEFPGTDEQFDALDADGDGLISAEEALEFDRKSRGTDNGAAAPESETEE